MPANISIRLPSASGLRFLTTVFYLLSSCLFFAPAFGHDNGDAVLASARSLIAAKRLPEVREPLEHFLSSAPSNTEARLLLARCYNGLQRYEDAINVLEPVIYSNAKDNPPSEAHLALYAEACLLRAQELGTSFRALSLARQGRDALEKASSLSPDNLVYREGLVDFYQSAPALAGGSRTKAFAHAQAITHLNPSRGGLIEAMLLADGKRYSDALSRCDTILATDPDNYLALYALGRIASDSGLRLADGTLALQRCLALTPSEVESPHSSVYFRLGLIEEKQKHRDKAREYFKASLQLAPDYRPAQTALRRVK